MARGKKIILGVTGGIAAYKTPEIVRLLVKRNIDVRVVMTKNAERFVTPYTLETLSGKPVWTADWQGHSDPLEHLDETRDADMVLVAPATANFIGKLAHGIADDVLTTTALALECPLFIAPAMNPRMYGNRAVQDNLRILKERGINIIYPDTGNTACGEEGEGRLPELDRLMAVVEHTLGLGRDLLGKKILITTGRTEEPVDTVRFISNRSSGKMGLAIAAAARDRGADVTLVHGPVSEPIPENITAVRVKTADEMFDAVMKSFPESDILIMAAAVADFKPAAIYDSKIKKKTAELAIPLTPTPDILENMGRQKKKQILVGFAAETENFLQNAREKMLRKNVDLMCLNDVSRNDIGFESDYNEIILISRTQEIKRLPRMQKTLLAHRLLDEISVLASPPQESRAAGRNG